MQGRIGWVYQKDRRESSEQIEKYKYKCDWKYKYKHKYKKYKYKYAREYRRMGVSEGLERELGAKVSGHRISLLIISSIKCPLFRRKTPRIFQHWRKNSRESAPLGTGRGGPKWIIRGEWGGVLWKGCWEEVIIIRRSLFCAISPDMLLQWRGSKYKYKYEYKCKYNYKYRYKYK